MDDVVAVAVTTSTGDVYHFMTWGRIFANADSTELEQVVLQSARGCSINGEPTRAELCHSLRDARDAPYFYEALLSFARPTHKPGLRRYKRWRKRTADAMRNGKQISFLG